MCWCAHEQLTNRRRYWSFHVHETSFLAFCLKEQFPDKNLLIRVQADSRGARIKLIILSRAALPIHLQFIPQIKPDILDFACWKYKWRTLLSSNNNFSLSPSNSASPPPRLELTNITLELPLGIFTKGDSSTVHALPRVKRRHGKWVCSVFLHQMLRTLDSRAGRG